MSAGEASSDLYAAELVQALRRILPDAACYYGCAGPRMREAGVEPVIEAESLSVVGLLEVVGHLPRIYREYRKLLAAVERRPPDLAVLTDSPDFHLRLARQLHRRGIPVVYLVAPQVWAWRKGRIRQMRRDLDRVLCIFPFEPAFFASHGIPAQYIGHPLAALVKPRLERGEFLAKHGLDPRRPLVTMLPGSRIGEAGRHLPVLCAAIERIRRAHPVEVILATPPGFAERAGARFFRERIPAASIQVVEGETWDAIAHADLALAASGTVTVEAALLGTPLVTFYRVTAISWWMGRFLVDVPFYSMVNLIADRQVVPELMQRDFTAAKLSAEALRLLEDPAARETMRAGLREVAEKLASSGHPLEHAARIVAEMIDGRQKQEILWRLETNVVSRVPLAGGVPSGPGCELSIPRRGREKL